MNKQKKERLFLGGLIIVLLIAMLNGILTINKYNKKKKVTKQKQSSSVEVDVSTRNVMNDFDNNVEALKNLEWFSDPFNANRNVAPAVFTYSNIELKGIIWEERNSYAIINDEIATIGDLVGGIEIVTINKKSIVVKEGSKLHVIPLTE